MDNLSCSLFVHLLFFIYCISFPALFFCHHTRHPLLLPYRCGRRLNICVSIAVRTYLKMKHDTNAKCCRSKVGGGKQRKIKHKKVWEKQQGLEEKHGRVGGHAALSWVHSSYFPLLIFLVIAHPHTLHPPYYFSGASNFTAVWRERLIASPCSKKCRWQDAPIFSSLTIQSPYQTPPPHILLFLLLWQIKTINKITKLSDWIIKYEREREREQRKYMWQRNQVGFSGSHLSQQ